MLNDVSILPSHKIDAEKWDACVAANSNGLIYATTVYLNAMADNWSGLVIDDYATVMPLPWRKKYGIRYLYTPPFTQQLGIIGNIEINQTQWLQALQRFVKYGTYLFNYDNNVALHGLKVSSCNNYIIDLNGNYPAIKKRYKKSFKQNIARAAKQQLTYTNSFKVEEPIALFYQYNCLKTNHVSSSDYSRFKQLCNTLCVTGDALIRKVVNSAGEILCIVLLLKDSKRYYNLINYTSPEGRKLEANYFLYDNLLMEFAESHMLFDFEGSDLPGVKAFYESTGAVNQPYYQWQFNKLPWPINVLKR